MRPGWPALILMLACASPLPARTITLTADDCDRMAVISAEVPRMSWAGTKLAPGIFTTYSQVYLFPNMAILMRFPLNQIPKGQRITRAELTIPADYIGGAKPRLYLRRLLVDWGTGVCHQYRMVHPKKIAWAEPGARGATSDRANKTSAIFNIDKTGDNSVDVTQDIDLWYTGGAINHGWIFTLDDPGSVIYMTSPYPAGGRWKLHITYEAK